jgi:cytoskeletal protein CcmA (bactofilin family)
MSESRLRRLSDQSSGNATLVAEDCTITGHIKAGGDFHVAGGIDGDCDVDGTVTLTRKGNWNGTIRAGHVIVAGHVEGDIVASGSIEIMDSARITGAVSGKAIAVAEGAVVEGQMMTTGHAEPTEFVEKRQSAD